MAKTRDSLGIFWQGEEHDGLLVYGFWPNDTTALPAFPTELWPTDADSKTRRLWGEGWTVWLWEVRLTSWPLAHKWEDTVEGTLERLISHGAEVAWTAVEGCFADPPSLFAPAEMADGVWACLSRGGIRYPPPSLDGAFRYLPVEVLRQLQDEVERCRAPATSPPR